MVNALSQPLFSDSPLSLFVVSIPFHSSWRCWLVHPVSWPCLIINCYDSLNLHILSWNEVNCQSSWMQSEFLIAIFILLTSVYLSFANNMWRLAFVGHFLDWLSTSAIVFNGCGELEAHLSITSSYPLSFYNYRSSWTCLLVHQHKNSTFWHSSSFGTSSFLTYAI